MQLRLDIICPFHQQQEVLALTESYSVDFSGEVPCGAERHQATLYIALTVGEVKELRLVESPLLYRIWGQDQPAAGDTDRPAPAGGRQRRRRPTAEPPNASRPMAPGLGNLR